jgi:hypothetical protein
VIGDRAGAGDRKGGRFFRNPGVRCGRSSQAGRAVLLVAGVPSGGGGRRGRFYWVGGREHLPPWGVVAAVVLAGILQVQRFSCLLSGALT